MTAALPSKIDAYTRHDGGISDYDKGGERNEYAFGRSIDYRSHPEEIGLLPRTSKESGSITTDLPKAGDLVGTDLYYYGDTGNIYKRTSAGSHSLLRSVANSHGNGMKYYTEDDFLYYTRDKLIGRYGQIGGTPAFNDDYLGSEGGVPLNTHWLDLESGSSQYASAADSASLSITGDLAIEATIKPESLPAVGSSMVLFSKWDINSNKRSYKFEIYALSGYFGDGSLGALTISADTTQAPTDSACTGTTGTNTLSATNASFAAGQQVLIHQTQGTGAGTWMKNRIAGYTAGTITLDSNLNATYGTGAQVIVMPQYSNITINSTKTWTAKAWNGTVGGILVFLATGTVTVTGSINAAGLAGATGGSGNNAGGAGIGFRGGLGTQGQTPSSYGEGTTGVSAQSSNGNPNGNGGGGSDNSGSDDTDSGAGGGGGGHGTAGTAGLGAGSSGYIGQGGNTAGTADLTTLVFGGGGGGGANGATESGGTGGGGGGGGIVFGAGVDIIITGSINVNGGNGGSGFRHGGSGAGGAVLLKFQTATLGTALITAAGGTGGGAGGVGRIHLDYYTSYTGTTSPTLDVAQDNGLVTTTTYQLRLGLSSNGTAEEFLARNSTIAVGAGAHVGVSWDASASTATFAQDGVSIGTATGAVTSLNTNASVAGIGADFNSTARNFYDGKIDEVRLWNTERTIAQFLANKNVQIAVNSAGLAAYYKLNNTYDDATANSNNMTSSGSPVFVTDVLWASPTGRLDLDQSLDTSGNTYALATAISETAAHRQTFVPDKDPQKSIEVLIAAIGTGNWTITVHDVLNRVVASKTVTAANLNTGDFEFIFSDVWRPIRGASYHFHLTTTIADGTVTTTTSNDLETADFHTYYQFLVEDVDYHPLEQMLNFLVVGNERYLAKIDAAGTYEPHHLVFPSGWKVRCFAKWREYIAIGCWKGDNIYDTDSGVIFFWNGYSTTYDFYIEVPEGGINAMFAKQGNLYVFAGYHGDMVVYQGGDSTNDLLKKRIPKMAETKYIETMPNAVTMWDGLLRWGVGGVSDSSDVERGVYTYGRRKASNPISVSYDYPISTGSRATTNVKIGFVFPVARKLLIGWKDSAAYGMDVVNPAGSPFMTGTLEMPILDYGRVSKEEKAITVRADFKPLASGEAFKVKYKLDRASSWTEGATNNEKGYASTVGDTFARISIPYGNFKEVQFAVDFEASTTSPKLLELGLERNPKDTQKIY